MRRLRTWFAKNYEAIKLGMLTGLLISNIFLISKVADSANKQRETTDVIKQQIAEDNEAREAIRAENAKSDQDFKIFICSLIRDLLIARNSSTAITSLESCANNIPEPTSVEQPTPQPNQTPVLPENNQQTNSQRQNPTNSAPPPKNDDPNPQNSPSITQQLLNELDKRTERIPVVKDLL